MSYLVSYMSLDNGWTAVVVRAHDADDARALAVLHYGVPAVRSPMLCQVLDGLPTIYNGDGALHHGTAQVEVA